MGKHVVEDCPQGGKHDPTTMERKAPTGQHVKFVACKKCGKRL